MHSDVLVLAYILKYSWSNLSLPSASDILRYILSCRASAIYGTPINLRYITSDISRCSPLLNRYAIDQLWWLRGIRLLWEVEMFLKEDNFLFKSAQAVASILIRRDVTQCQEKSRSCSKMSHWGKIKFHTVTPGGREFFLHFEPKFWIQCFKL